jgi:iron complex outermembrane receptor protein
LVYENGSSSPVEPSNFSAPAGSHITDVFSFVQHTWTTTWWLELNAGIRVDMYNNSPPFFSPRIGFLMVPLSDTSIKLLYGRAFRAPNAREWLVRLTPDEDGFVPYTNGNLNLLPESIDTIEAEATTALSSTLEFRSSMFYSLIQNEINKVLVTIPDPELGHNYYGNVGSSTIFGGEAEFSWKPSNFLGVLNYSFVHSINEDTGFQTYEFPPHMGHLRLGWHLGQSVWLTFRTDAYGPRPRSEWTAASSQLPDGEPFALCHLTVSALKLRKNLRVSASILNIFDQEHNYLVYQNDATETKNGSAKYPYDMSGEGRALYIAASSDF